MNLDHYPYIPKHITLRRYSEINIFDLKNDESYIIDDEALHVLKMVNGKNTANQIIGVFPQDKTNEVKEALISFLELGILDLSPSLIQDPLRISPTQISLPQKNPFDPPHLKNLMINITEKCNLKCKHCYITEKNPIDMDYERLKNIIIEFYKLQGIKIILTGGEPFLYTHLSELLEFLTDVPLQKVVLSNGILIKQNREILDLLKENNFEVYISLDGLEESHNDFRSADCFNDTIEGIKILLEADINVSINTMIHKQNLKQFDEIYTLIKTLGNIKNWAIDIPTFSNSTPAFIRKKYEVTPEEGGEILKDYGWGVIFESEGDPINYACGPYLMAVDVIGTVSKCGFFTELSPGNIFKLGLKKSWELIQKESNWSIEELKCYDLNCEYLEECRGGCRYRAFHRSNDIYGIDSFKCVQFGKVKNLKIK